MAISGWCRLVFFSDFVDSILAEGSYTHLKSDGDKLMQALKDQSLQDTTINETTQKRYLALGKRVQLHKNALMRWEMFHQREALMDGLSTLRHVFAISDREEDMAYVINELFMQQRAGLRSSLISPKSKNEVKTPQNVGRSMLIKRMVLSHLLTECPNLSVTLQPFVDHTYYETQYGVRPNGDRTRDAKDTDDNDDNSAYVLSFQMI